MKEQDRGGSSLYGNSNGTGNFKTRQQLTDERNDAAARNVLQHVREARGNHPGTEKPLPLLPNSRASASGIRDIPGLPGGSEPRTIDARLQPSAPRTVEVLPIAGGAASAGRMRDRRPIF
jgi:hypothetical protein